MRIPTKIGSNAWQKRRLFISRLATVIEWLIVVLVAAMSVAVFAQVLYRKVIEGSIPWSEEVARYLFVWSAWLGAALGIQRKAHFGITLLVQRFPAAWQRAINRIVRLAVALFLGVTFWKGIELAIGNWDQRSPAMRMPMTLPYLSVPVGALLMLCFWLIQEEEQRP